MRRILLSFIIFSIFSLGRCSRIVPGAEEYFQKRGRGVVHLKSSLDPSLCVRTVKLNENIKTLQLIYCNLNFDDYPYEGDAIFVIGKQFGNVGGFGPGGKTYFTLETESYIVEEDGKKPAVSFVARQNDGFVIAQPKDWDNSTYWRYPNVEGDKILVACQKPREWENELCLRAPTIENGTALDTIDCDNEDPKQIWIGKITGNDLKVYNTKYDKEPALAPAEPEKQNSEKNVGTALIQKPLFILGVQSLSFYLCRQYSYVPY